MYTISLLIFTTFIAFVRSDSDLLVKTNSGTIRGTRQCGPEGTFEVFYSIPFAEPPVGPLRFQPPVPVKPWHGIRDGTKPPPICPQPETFSIINGPVLGQEDCLYLNIFVPNITARNTKKAPVIFYIHGGAWQIGTANDYAGDYFMDKNIIFVAINYRLGVLGFLGMNNDIISGNFGMKDQAMALKWIKENIAAFGGDPDNITLMGESAGSMSVHAHMFSPLSKGLFHKVIMQSGSIFAPYAYYDETHTQASSTALAFITGCYNNNTAEVLKCLQLLSADDLIKAESKLYTWDIEPTISFRVTVESNVKHQPFLPHEPGRETYVTKNIPWITGINSAEAIFKVLRYLRDGGSLMNVINSNRKRLLPLINQYLFTTEAEYIDTITEKISDYYFGKDDIGISTASKFVQMLTDDLFVIPAMKTLLTYDGTRYAYYYDHQGSYSAAEKSGFKELGVCHGDEMPLLFRVEEAEKIWTPEDKRVSAELLKFWTNFAAFSDPNGNSTTKFWTPVQTNGIEYLHIRSNTSVMKKNFFKERYDFWNTLPTGRKYL